MSEKESIMGRPSAGLLILLLLFFETSVISGFSLAAQPTPLPKITIAAQFGLIYAPLMLADKLKIFEQNGLQPIWKAYQSEAAVCEALTSGAADVGFIGIPLFLIGWEKGYSWKVATGFAVVPVGLVAADPRIKSLADFKTGDKIAVPSVDSVQHILLTMAAAKKLGSPNALDLNIVAMAQQDAAALILERGIAAHFAIPPYLFEELNQTGFHSITNDKLILGHPFSFNIGVAAKKLHDQRPRQYSAFVKSIRYSFSWLDSHMSIAASLLAPDLKLTPQKALRYLTWPGMDYTPNVYGMMEFAYFMKRAGFLKKTPRNPAEIIWENVKLYR